MKCNGTKVLGILMAWAWLCFTLPADVATVGALRFHLAARGGVV